MTYELRIGGLWGCMKNYELQIRNYELVVYTRCMMNYGYLIWDVKRRLLSSIEKARRLLGYEPQTGFEE